MIDTNFQDAIRERVRVALEEDLSPYGDITADAIQSVSGTSTGQIISKSDGVLCGVDVVKEVFRQVDTDVQFPVGLDDGAEITNGTVVLEVAGETNALLKGERTGLNFLARLTGVASFTNRAVRAIEGTNVEILDTRKTTPGFRLLEKYAVRVGGGKNHRWGLYDQFLIKENHIKAAGGIENAVSSAREHLEKIRETMSWIPESAHAKALGQPVVVEVEVRNLQEVQVALDAGVDCMLLDNMSPEEIREAVALNSGRARLEISGGVTLDTLPNLARLGVDAISMGALTHSAPAHDFSFLLK